MLFFNKFLYEIEFFREYHKIIDVPYKYIDVPYKYIILELKYTESVSKLAIYQTLGYLSSYVQLKSLKVEINRKSYEHQC
jgi:hypothetical protein